MIVNTNNAIWESVPHHKEAIDNRIYKWNMGTKPSEVLKKFLDTKKEPNLGMFQVAFTDIEEYLVEFPLKGTVDDWASQHCTALREILGFNPSCDDVDDDIHSSDTEIIEEEKEEGDENKKPADKLVWQKGTIRTVRTPT
jgi:hypothetical protein